MAELTPDTRRRLIAVIQSEFPLIETPFAAIGESLGLSEREVIDSLVEMRRTGVLRQIGAIFATDRLGYTSSLLAFRVCPEMLEEVAGAIALHPGVSHNYGRDHTFNLWFTMTVPPGASLAREVETLASRPGVLDHLMLNKLRVFKIDARFGAGESAGETRGTGGTGATAQQPIEAEDVPFVRALQEHLPLESRPFRLVADAHGLAEAAVLNAGRRLLDVGIMRRYGATLRHRQVGYVANAMVCWEVQPEQVASAGRAAATFPAVSHCYERVTVPPAWPYSLYTMVHGRSREELDRVMLELHAAIEPARFAVLRTVKEYKKTRVRYFEA